VRPKHGSSTLGTSHDTRALACDGLRPWWHNSGRPIYAQAAALLLLCDGGGSKSARTSLFKEALTKVVQERGVESRVTHYPPYTSTYNPIEPRLFPPRTRACQGVIFSSVALVQDLRATATTQTGRAVRVNISHKASATGRKVAVNFKEHMGGIFDDALSQWSQRPPAKPEA
jgi:hypothetical protein